MPATTRKQANSKQQKTGPTQTVPGQQSKSSRGQNCDSQSNL